MAETHTKIAAALAAVNAYLQEEEMCSRSADLSSSSRPQQQTGTWGLSGRQNMMSMRQLIQMKAFSRF